MKTKIYYYSRTKKNVSSSWVYCKEPIKLCENVDNLFVALKGGLATKGFVSKDFLKALGRKGILINISRGSVIDENSLLDLLEKKKIFGAGLDVFPQEPYFGKFRKLDNVLLTPHIGSYAKEIRVNMEQEAIIKILSL